MAKPKITKIRRRLKVFRLKVFRLEVFPVKSHATRAQNGQLMTEILSTDKVYLWAIIQEKSQSSHICVEGVSSSFVSIIAELFERMSLGSLSSLIPCLFIREADVLRIISLVGSLSHLSES